MPPNTLGVLFGITGADLQTGLLPIGECNCSPNYWIFNIQTSSDITTAGSLTCATPADTCVCDFNGNCFAVRHRHPPALFVLLRRLQRPDDMPYLRGRGLLDTR